MEVKSHNNGETDLFLVDEYLHPNSSHISLVTQVLNLENQSNDDSTPELGSTNTV